MEAALSSRRLAAVSAFAIVMTAVPVAWAGAQGIWEVEALATLTRVPIAAVPETGLETGGPQRGFAVQVGGATTGTVVGGRVNGALSMISRRGNGGSRTLTIGATGGCSGCARGAMFGFQRVRRFRGSDAANRLWVLGSTELGLGRVAGMTPLGGRLGLSLMGVGLPRNSSISVSPGVAFGGYLNARAIFKPEEGRQFTGGPAASLRGNFILPVGNRRLSIGAHHLFITGAQTMIGASAAW